MAYDYDADANRNSCWAQWDEPDKDEPEDDIERVTCPRHGLTTVVDFDKENNLLELRCGCDV